MKVTLKFDYSGGLDLLNAMYCLKETLLSHCSRPHQKLMLHGRPHYFYRFETANATTIFETMTCIVRETKDGISIELKREKEKGV